MTPPVRVGVVGAGWWSTAVHLPAIAAHPDAALAGVADLDVAKAKRAAEAFGGQAVGSHEDLLEVGVDCLVVATPHDAHVEPAGAALAAGVDVLVEKPMVLRTIEAEELVREARRSGANLHVGYTFLYTRHVRHLRGAIAGGALGEVAYATGLFATAMRTLYDRIAEPSLEGTPGALFAPAADTYASRRHGGGQGFSQLSHPLSVLLHVLDVDPREVVALSASHGYPVDVSDAVAFRGARGELVTVGSTGIMRAPATASEEYRVFGDQGQALLDTAGGTLRYVAGERVEEQPPLAGDEIYPASEPVNRLVDCRLGRADVLASGELGLRVTRVLEALSVDEGAESGIAR